ncbi:MAG: hypothetical protein IJE07_13925 [Clostridia bacterium]|nr:hypothetical protein [Clostridia bacterium]
MGRLFNFLKAGFRLLTPKMRTVWAEPFIDEPCVFVCSHIGAMGPIHMAVNFPLCDNVAIWCNCQVMDRSECAEYVRHDFWWKPESRLAPLYSATIPHIAAAVLPPVLTSAPTIPVYHDARVMTTMRQSIKALKAGQHVVIFPEKPSGYGEYDRRINTGWLNLLVMYHRMTGKALRMWPVWIDQKGHTFYIGEHVRYDPERPLEEQEDALAEALGCGLRGENR